jgi:peptidase inhibitor family I36
MISRRTLPRSRRLAVALALGIVALVAGAAPAAAAPDPAAATVVPQPSLPDGCPANSLCLHLERDLLGGHIFVIPGGASVPNLHLFACAECDSPRHSAGDGNFGDQMSSYVNNTSLTYCWWFDINYQRFGGTFLPHEVNKWVGKVHQDELSSTRPC